MGATGAADASHHLCCTATRGQPGSYRCVVVGCTAGSVSAVALICVRVRSKGSTMILHHHNKHMLTQPLRRVVKPGSSGSVG